MGTTCFLCDVTERAIAGDWISLCPQYFSKVYFLHHRFLQWCDFHIQWRFLTQRLLRILSEALCFFYVLTRLFLKATMYTQEGLLTGLCGQMRLCDNDGNRSSTRVMILCHTLNSSLDLWTDKPFPGLHWQLRCTQFPPLPQQTQSRAERNTEICSIYTSPLSSFSCQWPLLKACYIIYKKKQKTKNISDLLWEKKKSNWDHEKANP